MLFPYLTTVPCSNSSPITGLIVLSSSPFLRKSLLTPAQSKSPVSPDSFTSELHTIRVVTGECVLTGPTHENVKMLVALAGAQKLAGVNE